MAEIIRQHTISAEEASALLHAIEKAGEDGVYTPTEMRPIRAMAKAHCIRAQVIDVGEKGKGQIDKRSILAPWNAPLQREIDQLGEMISTYGGGVVHDIVERMTSSVIMREEKRA